MGVSRISLGLAGLGLFTLASILGVRGSAEGDADMRRIDSQVAAGVEAARSDLEHVFDRAELAARIQANGRTREAIKGTAAEFAFAARSLDALVGVDPRSFSSAALVDSDGRVVVATTTGERPADLLPAAGSAVRSAPHPGPTGDEVITTAVGLPVVDGAVPGSIQVDTPVAALTQALNRPLSPDSATQVRTGEGLVITSSGDARDGGYGLVTGRGLLKSTAGTALFVEVAQAAPATGAGTLTPFSVGLAVAGLGLMAGAVIAWWRSLREERAARQRAVAERDRLSLHMDDMSEVLARAGAGDLGVHLPTDINDPRVATLARSFDDTLARLRTLVAQAQDNGVTLGTAATELRAASTQQAAAASQQSMMVMETTATIQELAATAAQIAQTSEQVAEAARETLRLTEHGYQAVSQSVETMEDISARVERVSGHAVSLGQRTQEIGRIVAVIDELADQTNLLALNAAIEAARAGEHGRGFAVVALEVRKLAERASEATGRIQAIVVEIQAETSATILATDTGAAKVRQGVQLAREVAEALDDIAEMVDETTTATREISVATQQQRSASEQVVVAMTQVTDASQSYAVGSQQTAASADELAAVALKMRGSIETFNVDMGPAD